MSAPEFDLDTSTLLNGTVIEASAGTGKTFSVASVVVKELALDPGLRIGGILITTYTRNAAAELRDRVRRRLAVVERQLRSQAHPTDPLAADLHGADRLDRADRLGRALREFDNATITTIHSVCSRILTLAGETSVDEGQGSDLRRVLEEVVNDAVVESAEAGLVLQSARLKDAVAELVRSPKARLHRMTMTGDDPAENTRVNGELAAVARVVRECADEVHRRTELAPTFDDMLRRAEIAVSDPKRPAVVAALRQRYTLAVIDEAQDTDHLQWSIFRHVFDGRQPNRRLVAVGDPKQAIYRFRGADVEAYLDARDVNNMFTLSRNWRSDADLIRVLNKVFSGRTFGDSISYKAVTARPGAPASAIVGDVPLVLVDLGEKTRAEQVVAPAALRVREILATVKVPSENGLRAVRPSDVCVLVLANSRGSAIEDALRGMGIAAVSSGTENVMGGDMARALVGLLQAMDNPHDSGLVRIAAATPFFGRNLADVGSLSDETIQEIQGAIAALNSVLRRRGVAAFAARLRSDPEVSSRLVGGPDGERNETDFAHIVELLHTETGGAGCPARSVLEHVDELASREATAETVSRRVESDKDAVQIMTVHQSKGLEFPVVVVADLWKRGGRSKGVPVVHLESAAPGGPRERVIDVGYVLDLPDKAFADRRKRSAEAETDRLFYVAMTRARHHVSLLVSTGKKRGVAPTRKPRPTPGRSTDGIIDIFVGEYPKDASVRVTDETSIRRFRAYSMRGRSLDKMTVAQVSNPILQTYERLSFSSIVRRGDGHHGEGAAAEDDRSGSGHGDDDQIISVGSGYAPDHVPPGVTEMPLARLVGGTRFGKIVHKVYEQVDFCADPLDSEVARVVGEVITGAALRHEHPRIIRGVELSLRTPLGGALGETRLVDIPGADRLSELGFEMTLADHARRTNVGRFGRALEKALVREGRSGDPLVAYARGIADRWGHINLLGLMNGSIDALLRVDGGAQMDLWVSDFKTNRLDKEGDESLIAAYGIDSMLNEMFRHHYPLQALIYGTAVHRYVRSRSGATGPPHRVRGFAYLFVRGMVGAATPVDASGNRHGVVTWTAPEGLWDSLSAVMMGERP